MTFSNVTCTTCKAIDDYNLRIRAECVYCKRCLNLINLIKQRPFSKIPFARIRIKGTIKGIVR